MCPFASQNVFLLLQGESTSTLACTHGVPSGRSQAAPLSFAITILAIISSVISVMRMVPSSRSCFKTSAGVTDLTILDSFPTLISRPTASTVDVVRIPPTGMRVARSPSFCGRKSTSSSSLSLRRMGFARSSGSLVTPLSTITHPRFLSARMTRPRSTWSVSDSWSVDRAAKSSTLPTPNFGRRRGRAATSSSPTEARRSDSLSSSFSTFQFLERATRCSGSSGSCSRSIAMIPGTTALTSALLAEMFTPDSRSISSIVSRTECSPAFRSRKRRSPLAPSSQSAAESFDLWHGSCAILVTSSCASASVENDEKLLPFPSLHSSRSTFFLPRSLFPSAYSYSSSVMSSARCASWSCRIPPSETTSRMFFAGFSPNLSRTSHASPSGAKTVTGSPSRVRSFCSAPARREAMSLSECPCASFSR
mmetsp:Transcript_19493/g.47206  ORF Transcript_19493/g.47206 Transcript_19493/m.47206 type:complete len:421 (-) Transcript_19493:128-1390(-)